MYLSCKEVTLGDMKPLAELLSLHISSLLIQVWTTTIRAVVDLTLGPRMKWRSYERLYHTLKALQAFFNANGEGLSNDELETEEYKVIIFHTASRLSHACFVSVL